MSTCHDLKSFFVVSVAFLENVKVWVETRLQSSLQRTHPHSESTFTLVLGHVQCNARLHVQCNARLLGNRNKLERTDCHLKISVTLVVSSVPESHAINKVHCTLAVQHASAKGKAVSQCMRLQGYMFWIQVLSYTQMLCRLKMSRTFPSITH